MLDHQKTYFLYPKFEKDRQYYSKHRFYETSKKISLKFEVFDEYFRIFVWLAIRMSSGTIGYPNTFYKPDKLPESCFLKQSLTGSGSKYYKFFVSEMGVCIFCGNQIFLLVYQLQIHKIIQHSGISEK